MKFEIIAELAGDIVGSEERKELILRNCKKEYRSQKEKVDSLANMMSDYYKKHQAQ